MEWWTCFLIFPVCALIYLLYINGFAVLKRIRAVLFVFRRGKNADKATLTSCTGWIRHMVRFHKSGTYEFTLDCQLSEGDAEVFLSDKKKQQLLKLDRQSPVGKVELEGKSRYILSWKFKSATGKCELHRQRK